MKNIKKIYEICRYQTVMQIANVKTAAIVTILFFYIRGMMGPIKDFLDAVGAKMNPFVFPLMLGDSFAPLVILIGYLVLICDAPFIKRGYLFIVSRSGKKCWALGEVLFLVFNAVLYTAVIWIFSIINLLPYIDWQSDWGKAILTLAKTDAAQQFNVTLFFDQRIINNYAPMEAMIKSVILFVLGLIFIGLVVFALNYFVKGNAGLIAAIILIFMDIVIWNLFPLGWIKYSPASLMKLSVVTGIGRAPSYVYGLCVLGIGSLLLAVVITLGVSMKKGLIMMDRRNQ